MPPIVHVLGRSYGQVIPDVLGDLASEDRSAWETSLVELTFRHMMAGAGVGLVGVVLSEAAASLAPPLETVVIGLVAGVLLALWVSLMWLTAQGQRAKRLDQPPVSILKVRKSVGFAPIALGATATVLWLLLL